MANVLYFPVFRAFDANGAPLVGGKVYTYAAGTSTPKVSYTDATMSTDNSNPVILDANGEASIWISGSYRINLTDANDVQQPKFPVDQFTNDSGTPGPAGTFAMVTAGGTADAITANYTPDVTLSNLTTVGFVAGFDNATTTPTFAPDGLTAHTITKNGGAALVAGDIKALGTYIVEYNSANTRWELLNPATAIIPAGSIALTKLAVQAGNSVVAEVTGSSASPTAVTMGASTILARLAAGNVKAASVVEIQTLLGIVTPIFTLSYTSTAQTITAGGSLTLAHGLGVTPKFVQAYLKNTSTELNYSVNDEVFVQCGGEGSSGGFGISLVRDATNLNIRFGATGFILLNKTTGAQSGITNNKWNFFIQAWA